MMRNNGSKLVPLFLVVLPLFGAGCKKSAGQPASSSSGQPQVVCNPTAPIEIPIALADDPALLRAQAFLNLTQDLHNRVVEFRESLCNDSITSNQRKGN